MLGAACLVGVAAFLVSTMTYDAMTLLQGARVLWLLVALGTVVAERRAGPIPVAVPQWQRPVVALVGGALAGAVAFALTPVHTAEELIFTTQPPADLDAPYPAIASGTTFVDTVCTLARLEARSLPDASVDCVRTRAGLGIGSLRVQAGSPKVMVVLAQGVASIVHADARLIDYRPYELDHASTSRPSVLTGAPVWLPILTTMTTLLVPGLARRRPRP
jgi:hypothetical protein